MPVHRPYHTDPQPLDKCEESATELRGLGHYDYVYITHSGETKAKYWEQGIVWTMTSILPKGKPE